ncbi:PIN domain-containing protein [Bradyrhizobium cosmicum]
MFLSRHAFGAVVWTTDRDFARTGVATWSTPNFMRALAEAGAKGVLS